MVIRGIQQQQSKEINVYRKSILNRIKVKHDTETKTRFVCYEPRRG